MKGPALLGGGGSRKSVGVGSRDFGSVGSLNVFGKGGAAKVKESAAGSSGSMSNLRLESPLASRKSFLPSPKVESGHLSPGGGWSGSSVTQSDVGSPVYISGVQSGILRFYGETKFKPGVTWCGIELPEPQGSHDGGVDGVRYFKARKNCGIFAPVEKVTLKPPESRKPDSSASNSRRSLVPSPLSRENSGSAVMEPKVHPEPQPPSGKGSKRPKSVLEHSDKTFTVAKMKISLPPEQLKRRRLEEVSSPSCSEPPPSDIPSCVRVPNFAEINKLNLREEMEQSVNSSLLSPSHSSTPTRALLWSESRKGFPLQNRRPSIIKTPTDLPGQERVVLTPPPPGKGVTSSGWIGGCRTYVVEQQTPYESATRPTTLLGLERRGSEEEEVEPASEASSSDAGGLFGQKTPELWDGDGVSLAGLSSPEEAGIQEESSLGLGGTTPSLFESWGDLKEDELELYQHLRSPSIDNLDFDEEEEDTHNALDLEDGLNHTLILAQDYARDEEKPEKSDPTKLSPTQSIEEIDGRQSPKVCKPPPPQEHLPEPEPRPISATYDPEPATDSDFNTESEPDHDELLSHPIHVPPNKNRNARVIDGALYTSSSLPPSKSPSQPPSTTTSHCEEPESSSSGFYSSSESGSLTRGGSRHPSNTRSRSGSDCEESSVGSKDDVENEVTLLNSTSTTMSTTTELDASSTLATERNSPEEVGVAFLGKGGASSLLSTISQSCEGGLQLEGLVSDKKVVSRLHQIRDDCSVGSGGSEPLKPGFNFKSRARDSVMNRSQSVSCLSSLPGPPSRYRFVTTRAKEKVVAPVVTGQSKTRVLGKPSSLLAETVASSSRRLGSIAFGSRLGGSSVSLASSTSNLTTTSGKSPSSRGSRMGGGGKWDSVMAKINEGKGKQINVKEVRAKVFDRLGGGGGNKPGPTSNASGGSTSSLVGVGKKKTFRSEKDSKDVENEPVVKKSGGGGARAPVSKRGGGSGLTRTDSTSSDGSEGNVQPRTQFTTKYRPKKENGPPRRQVSDVSTASECSASQSQPIPGPVTTQTKSKAGRKASVTILERNSSTTTKSSTAVAMSKASGVPSTLSKGPRTLSGSSGSSQLKSPLRASPGSLKGKGKKTTGTGSSASLAATLPATLPTKPVLDGAAQISNKGSTKQVAPTLPGRTRSSQSQPDPAIKPLRDHNRIPTSGSTLPNPTTKSKDVPATNTRSRRREDKEAPVGDKESGATLREQLSRLKIQLDALQSEDVVNKEEIQRLSNSNSHSLEEQGRLVAELVQFSKKVQAMAVVVRHIDEKNGHLSSRVHCKSQKAEELEGLLKVAEDKSKQVPVLSGQLTAVHAIHRGELRDLREGYQIKIQNLVEGHTHEFETLKSSYDDKLAEKDAEMESLKETHRLEMESLLATRLNASPHDVLLKDIASMTAVIEMQNQRVKELQTRVQLLTLKEEELVKSENLGRTLSARVEDLEAQINSNKYDKTTLLAQLAESETSLEDALSKNRTLVQSVDELTFKLNHPDIVPASPSASKFKEST